MTVRSDLQRLSKKHMLKGNLNKILRRIFGPKRNENGA